MERIFGFDIGTTSIGWAVIDYDAERGEGRIVAKAGVPGMGVRIFPEARDPDGTPLNQQRRQKRMVRRQLRRRRQRRRLLNELLCSAGLLPPFSKDKDSEWTKVMRLDPYPLRDKGVAEPLSIHEFGRAIYHLSKRRHFKGRDLEGDDPLEAKVDGAQGAALDAEEPKRLKKEKPQNATGNGDDEKKLKEEILSTHRMLEKSGKTLGQWLAAKYADAKKGAPPQERRRMAHAHRVDVEDEFERLWAAQAIHHKSLDDAGLKERVMGAIFAQKPVFWRKATLGKCRFVPDQELCPRGSWLSQQRRMLEKLNDLAIAGGNARPLDAEERTAILEKLQTQALMTWGGVRRILKPILRKKDQAEDPKFNLELDEGGALLGNPLEAKLAGIFGEGWREHLRKQDIRDAVQERLWDADYDTVGDRDGGPAQRVVVRASSGPKGRKTLRAAAAQSFIADFGATEEQAATLRDLNLPTGWEPFSTSALKAILVELEKGEPFGALVNAANDDRIMRTRENTTKETYGAWREANFPDRERPTGVELDVLPSPAVKEERERIKTLRNPTVVRTQNELRKVVNNLIRVYGKPALIRIELARDVGKSKREREEILADIRKNEKKRTAGIKDLESKGVLGPSRDVVEKWMLWKEAAEICPYTGDKISFDALFREGRFEVEHIWPRWRSFDDAARNKTLCRKDINNLKRNKTPFEAFAHDEEKWTEIRNRLDGMTAKKGGPGMSPGKVKRFLATAMPKEFASRQLNDTGYAARQAIAFLKRLWPDEGPMAPVYVQPVSGKVTAQLRRRWGLDYILADDGEKTRADHRHHAIDALAVACAHPGVTNKLSRYYQLKDELSAKAPPLDPPWPNIRKDAEAAVAKIVVSHRVRKKVSGPLHKETTYGDTGDDVKTKTGVYRQFVTRKKVDALSKNELHEIRDSKVRRLVTAHVAANGGEPKKAFEAYPTVSESGPPIRKVRLLMKQQMNLMAPVATGFADAGLNHHLAIYQLPDGRSDYEVVSLFEATRRHGRREPIVRKERPDARFTMSLSPGDAVEFPDGERKGFRIVRSVWQAGPVVTLDHRDADGASVWRPSPGSLFASNARKVSIDPIGRVRPARD